MAAEGSVLFSEHILYKQVEPFGKTNDPHPKSRKNFTIVADEKKLQIMDPVVSKTTY